MGLFDFMRGSGRLSQGPTRPQLYQTETYTPQTSNNVKAALNDPNAPQYITANRMTLNRPGTTGGPVQVNPLPPMPQQRQTNALTDAATYMKQVDEFSKFSNAPLSDKLMALSSAFSSTTADDNYMKDYEQGIRDRFTERRTQEVEARRKDFGDIQYVGDANTGKLMRQNKTTGQLEDVTDQYPPSVIDAFKAQFKAKEFKGQVLDPRTGGLISPADAARDKKFVEGLVKNPTTNMAQDISELGLVLQQLKSPDGGDLTGLSFTSPIDSVARLVDSQGDLGLRAMVDTKSKDMQDIVNRVTQQSLRVTLGAQFTQREGFMLIQRAYDVRLPPEMNARRIAVAREASKMLREERLAQEKYFNENRTLAGYVSPIASSLEQMNQRIQAVYAQNSSDFGDEYKQAQNDLREIGGTVSLQRPSENTTPNNQTATDPVLEEILKQYPEKNK
jgi:hypothetical protein